MLISGADMKPLETHKKETQQFGMTMKIFRKERGLTQEDLYGLTGISVSHISNIENAKTNPSLEMLLTFADAFHVPISDLFKLGK